jgi:D-alanine-D-alanine ligase-like ATP-grasp enzyme
MSAKETNFQSLKINPKPGMVKCLVCGKWFKKRGLSTHMRMAHRISR